MIDRHVLQARVVRTAFGSTNDIKTVRDYTIETNAISNVLAAVGANGGNTQEIADRSGVEVGSVKKILRFLTDFGFVRVEGSRMVVEQELLRLPVD